MTQYEERLKLFRDVVAMRPVSKIPVSINGPAYVARSQKIPMKNFITDFPRAVDGDIRLFRQLGTADFLQTPIIDPRGLATQWFSPVATPGRELPDDELWQVIEQETFSFEDYDRIMKNGFLAFQDWILKEKLGDVNAQIGDFYRYYPVAVERMKQAGVVVINDGPVIVQPFEMFCGGRTLANFFCDDLFEETEYMHDVFEKSMEDLVPYYSKMLEGGNLLACWVGGWRSAPEMLSREMWDEFVWPYMKKLAMIVIEHGVTPIFHLDSNWDREIERFTELPEHTCILSLDGASDIKRAREKLGDHSCLMGDVPANMLAFSEPDEIRTYVRSVIEACGPETGLIVCSGCDIAPNAKDENVKAMVDTAAEFRA